MASVNMEKEGLLKQLEFFKEKRIKIRSLVTDSHPATRKPMETHKPGIDHFFDIRHISKTASKRAGCQDLQIWIQTATNHMYWSARAAGGDKELLIDIWLSMHNHVINKHSGHKGTYGRCLYDSQAYNQFKSVTGDKRLLKDLAQMSPHGQAYALEAFHSVLIDFAPKFQAFGPEGMLANEPKRKRSDLAKELDLPPSTLCTIVGQQDTILKNVQHFSGNVKQAKTAQHVKLEDILLTWFKEVTAAGVNIDGKVLREKADDVALSLGIENFQASGGLVHRFKQRHGLHFPDRSRSGKYGHFNNKSATPSRLAQTQ
ncbi:hypothetical protein HPB47_015841 [Ixodes persulcatus]|uniref:Uncharacterized protein n=1 Tax=Ixodes persulcatus TaxID=34615 RepID=A0AC60QSJ5_IXOPE|nr:hypothetical protein HPB47_015841 [Ixodes persulcatus]